MTSRSDKMILAKESRRKALDEAFNECQDAVSDEGVFSPDQIHALLRMIDLLRAVYAAH